MKDWRNIALAIGILSLVAAFLFWKQEHDAKLKLTTELSAIKRNTQQEVKTIEVERKAADTPQKQIQYVEKYVPIHLNFPTPDVTADVALNVSADALNSSALPDSPGVIWMPPADLPKLADYVENCNKLGAELKGCRAEVEEYKKQKGGFWHKVGGCGLRVGLGALGGLATNNRGIAIGGAAAGGATCFIWRP